MPMVAVEERGVHPPDPLLVGAVREVPRNKLERELWSFRDESRLHNVYRCTFEDLVRRASRLLDELPMAFVGCRGWPGFFQLDEQTHQRVVQARGAVAWVA